MRSPSQRIGGRRVGARRQEDSRRGGCSWRGGLDREDKARRTDGAGLRGRDRRQSVWVALVGEIAGEEFHEGVDFMQDSEEGGADEFVFIPNSPDDGLDEDLDTQELFKVGNFVPDTEDQFVVKGAAKERGGALDHAAASVAVEEESRAELVLSSISVAAEEWPGQEEWGSELVPASISMPAKKEGRGGELLPACASVPGEEELPGELAVDSAALFVDLETYCEEEGTGILAAKSSAQDGAFVATFCPGWHGGWAGGILAHN